MAEQCDLSLPEAKLAILNWMVSQLIITWPDVIKIDLVANTGEHRHFVYNGLIAQTLIKALNTANLSVRSLHRRILERLMVDGHLVGTISGTPDA